MLAVRKASRGIVAALALAVLAVAAAEAPAQAQPTAAPALRPDAPLTAQRSDPVAHKVDFTVVVTPPYRCRVLKVWLPIPPSDEAQQISERRLSTFPMRVAPQIGTEPVYGNQFAYFEFHDPRGAQMIRHRFQATVWNLHWGLDARSVDEVKHWPESFGPYLQHEALDNERQFQTVLRSIVPPGTGAGVDLHRVMHWIEENLTYDHENASLQADVNHAFSQRRGHCSDYHGLCATMGRSLGHPSRVTYGLSLFPKNSPSHCKMEAFLPPYGWISFDLSETQKLIKRIQASESLSAADKAALTEAARRRLLRGFRENSWLSLTRGADYELAPRASRRVRVVRTAYVEADGEPLPEPDPASATQRGFSWMTVHDYQADKAFKLPFEDLSTLSTLTAD